MKRFGLALLLALTPLSAWAQSPCPAIAHFGAVLTVAQWQSCFTAKADVGTGGGGASTVTGAQVIAALTFTPVNKAGDTMTGKLVTVAPSVATASLNLPHGSAPTTPVNGDTWTTTAGLFIRINGATIGPITVPGAGFATLGAPNTFTAENAFTGGVDVGLRNLTSNTTLALTDSVVCGDLSGGSFTLTTPPNPIPNGHTLTVIDCMNLASPTVILTVAGNSGQTVCKAGSAPLKTLGAAINLTWNLVKLDWNCS